MQTGSANRPRQGAREAVHCPSDNFGSGNAELRIMGGHDTAPLIGLRLSLTKHFLTLNGCISNWALFVTVFLIIAVIVLLLTWCVYLARRHQIEDFRTWVLVEGIPVAFVTTILLLVVWLVLGRM